MHITVLFFASAKDAAGAASRTFDVQDGSVVQDVAAMLGREYPALRALMPSVRFAVNLALAANTTPVSDGDEIAVLPPVSGG